MQSLHASWRSQAPAPRKPTGHRNLSVVCSASLLRNPYRILGLEEHAEAQDVKKAYRKLALQFHPDVCKSPDAQVKFLSITEAYELITGRARGKEDTDHSSSNSWDFHDWYWSFRGSRSWEKQQTSGSADIPHTPGYQQPESKDHVQSQLAGLRHRAAVRAQKRRSQPDSECDEPADTTYHSGYAAHDHQFGAWSNMSGSGQHASHAGSYSYPHHLHVNWEFASSAPKHSAQETSDEAAAPAAAPASSSAHSTTLSMHTPEVVDGHFATLLNNAVPFSSAHSATASLDSRRAYVGNAAKPNSANQAHHTATEAESETDRELSVMPEPEPFSNPWEKKAGAAASDPWATGQSAGSARRRFVASEDTREGVSHQLEGLRRKAKIKVTASGR